MKNTYVCTCKLHSLKNNFFFLFFRVYHKHQPVVLVGKQARVVPAQVLGWSMVLVPIMKTSGMVLA